MSTPKGWLPLAPPLSTRAGVGRTAELIRCPFCSDPIWTFVWSRAGRGKNCKCGATLYRSNARPPKEPSK